MLLDFNKPFQVRCDVSDVSIEVIISQEDKPIAYFSEKLNESKKTYFPYHKEFYVVIRALNKWRHI